MDKKSTCRLKDVVNRTIRTHDKACVNKEGSVRHKQSMSMISLTAKNDNIKSDQSFAEKDRNQLK